jgi:hypothetical protein
MTKDEITKMAVDLKALKDMLPSIPPVEDAINDAVNPVNQTVLPALTKVIVPVLTDVVAPTLLSVEARLDALALTYEQLAAEVSAIRTEVAKIAKFLATK